MVVFRFKRGSRQREEEFTGDPREGRERRRV